MSCTVMPGLVPGIQNHERMRKSLWIAGTGPAMTGVRERVAEAYVDLAREA